MLRLEEYVQRFQPEKGIHGDCIGADVQFSALCDSLQVTVEIHPPEDDSKRAFCKARITFPVKPYLERNHDIVNACDKLIACPSGNTEVLRSGTWATIRYAKGKKPIIVIYPKGSVELL
jgi:hypothetical protein